MLVNWGGKKSKEEDKKNSQLNNKRVLHVEMAPLIWVHSFQNNSQTIVQVL